MTIDLHLANPAGNITAFVTSPVERLQYGKVAEQIMANYVADPPIEQVGYITTPLYGGDVRVDMMGLEFCGNATRSAGMIYAPNVEGTQQIMVECSGLISPMAVMVNRSQGTAFVEMPLPLRQKSIPCGRFGELGLVVFDGITHIIAPKIEATPENFHRIAALLPPEVDSSALGIMFYNNERLTPYVYIEATNSLILEGSCGSGSSALAHWLARRECKSQTYEIKQPSGTLTVVVTYLEGNLVGISMGGKVTYDNPTTMTLPDS